MATTTSSAVPTPGDPIATMAESSTEHEHEAQSQLQQHEIQSHNDQTPMVTAVSAIAELEHALGPLLQSRKDPNDSFNILRRWSIWDPPKKLNPQPFSPSGVFRLLDLPRELREQVYSHYLYSPSDLLLRREQVRPQSRDHVSFTIRLFLICKQVYREAYATLFRESMVIMRPHHYGPQRYPEGSLAHRASGVLRLVPPQIANALHKVEWTYHGVTGRPGRYWNPDAWEMSSASCVFEQMLRDVELFKQVFPKMRVFRAVWVAKEGQLEHERGLSRFVRMAREVVEEGEEREESMSDEMQEKVWYEWMMGVLRGRNVKPRRELGITIMGWWCDNVGMRDEILGRAYERCLRDCKAKNDDVEMDGKRWLEETAWKKDDEWWMKKGRRKRRLKD